MRSPKRQTNKRHTYAAFYSLPFSLHHFIAPPHVLSFCGIGAGMLLTGRSMRVSCARRSTGLKAKMPVSWTRAASSSSRAFLTFSGDVSPWTWRRTKNSHWRDGSKVADVKRSSHDGSEASGVGGAPGAAGVALGRR